jgi:hypothetical protein
MSFSNSELQQLKSILADQIRTIEVRKSQVKRDITKLVELKQPFKKSGTKSVVDKYNDMIRVQYKHVDKADKQLKKFRALQQAVKREMADQVDAIRIQKAAVPLMASIKGLVARKEQEAATAGFAQVQGTVLGGLQSSGVSPAFAGWQDRVMENFIPAQPSILTGIVHTPVINPDPSYDQPALDNRWYTVPNRIVNPGFEVDQRSSGMKPSNPKDAIGSDKLPLHLWPATATAMGCIGFLNGMLKYGRANFRAIGIRASIYIDAAKRHLDAWFEGEECDPDDGVPHLAAALACIGIVVDAIAADKLNDDRNVRGGYRRLVGQLTPHVARLKALHAGKNPKHYTIADNASLV